MIQPHNVSALLPDVTDSELVAEMFNKHPEGDLLFSIIEEAVEDLEDYAKEEAYEEGHDAGYQEGYNDATFDLDVL